MNNADGNAKIQEDTEEYAEDGKDTAAPNINEDNGIDENTDDEIKSDTDEREEAEPDSNINRDNQNQGNSNQNNINQNNTNQSKKELSFVERLKKENRRCRRPVAARRPLGCTMTGKGNLSFLFKLEVAHYAL